jgi:peptidoglycan-associated lipoprotein
MYSVMRTHARSAAAIALLALALGAGPARAAGGAKAIVYPDRSKPDLAVPVDSFRINETVWDFGGVQYVWLDGPAGHFRLPFKRIRQIEVVKWLGLDTSRTDWVRYEVLVTGVKPGESYAGRIEIRVLSGVAAGVPWYLFPATNTDKGRQLYRIVFGDVPVPPTIPWETPPKATAAPPVAVVVPPPARPPLPPSPPEPTEDERFGRLTVDDLNRQKPLDDVFFDFDKSSIRPDAEATLLKNAAWLKRWPSVRVRVDGCADPRGTNEYNFGLGMRRADTIRTFLAGQGIAPDRIEVVTLGETQLVCTEQTEACWARNRAGRFTITAK